MAEGEILTALQLRKAYDGVPALKGVDLHMRAGEVHALVGENGAGKSTLVRILAGQVAPDAGTILLEGRPVILPEPRAALRLGIATVHQELSLVPCLPVYVNLWLGHEKGLGAAGAGYGAGAGRVSAESSAPASGWQRWLSRFPVARMRQAAAALCRRFDVEVDLDSWVEDLPLEDQQVVEILKALAWNPRILILDEPTSALGARRSRWLMELMSRLAREGLSILFISHRLAEVLEVASTITVLKDGENAGTVRRVEATEAQIVRMMAGRELNDIFPAKVATERAATPTRPALEVKHLSVAGGQVRQVTLVAYPGQVVGIAGLEGHGQRALMLALFGLERITSGEVWLHGQRLHLNSPSSAIAQGVALVPVDRRTEGLVLPLSIQENLALPTLLARQRWGLVRRDEERREASRMVAELGVRAWGLDQPVRTLSGGNQQKVVLGKWLMARPRLMLLDDPTRGVDVQTRRDLYHRIRQLAGTGTVVLINSTDVTELVGLCDTVYVMYEGRVVAELTGEAITEERIVAAAVGLEDRGAGLATHAG